jgi:hypothetical protein
VPDFNLVNREPARSSHAGEVRQPAPEPAPEPAVSETVAEPAPEAAAGTVPQEPPEVEKLAEKQWTHEETDQVFPTKREAEADAADPTPPAESAGPTDPDPDITPTEEHTDELPQP